MPRAGIAAKELGVSTSTIRNWVRNGQIHYTHTAGGQRRYDTTSVKHRNPENNTNNIQQQAKTSSVTQAKGAIYCRVSSSKQKDDLESQKAALVQAYPNFQVFEDIYSGLKNKRKGLTRLLEQVKAGFIETVVAANKDRLTRFGVEIIEWFIVNSRATLVILDHHSLEPNEELT
jgi:putative resolvase